RECIGAGRRFGRRAFAGDVAPTRLALFQRLADLRLAALQAGEILRARAARLLAAQVLPPARERLHEVEALEGDAAHGDIEEQHERRREDEPVPDRLKALVAGRPGPEDDSRSRRVGERAVVVGVALAARQFAQALEQVGVALHVGEFRRVGNRHARPHALALLDFFAVALYLAHGLEGDEIRSCLLGLELRLVDAAVAL